MTVTLERPTAEDKTASLLLPERDAEFHWTVDAYYKDQGYTEQSANELLKYVGTLLNR